MFADCEDEPLLTVTMEDETRQSRQMPCDASGSQCELCTMDDLIQKGQAENRWSSAHSQTVKWNITESMTMKNPHMQTCNIVLAFFFFF